MLLGGFLHHDVAIADGRVYWLEARYASHNALCQCATLERLTQGRAMREQGIQAVRPRLDAGVRHLTSHVYLRISASGSRYLLTMQ